MEGRMPLYEYECPECGRKLEMRRSMTEADQEVRCPECRKGILKRVLSIFSTASPGENCAPSGST
jgi:putative FmdB family regulatory protein